MPEIITSPAPTGGGGGTGGPETDPIAGPSIQAHKTAADPHGSNTHADAGDAAHVAAADPHGDRAHGDAADTAHLNAADPHASNVHSDGALGAHVGAADPHGDRAAAATHADAADTAHASAVDPHGDRAAAATHADGADAAHVAAADPHGDRAALNAHTGAVAAAHAASAVSVNAAGLAVVTTTNVQAALAQLDAASVTRVTKPAAPADGDGIIWSAAQGAYVSAKPTQELAYAEIQANYVMTGAAANVPGLSMVVPASTVPVELEIMLPVYNIQCNASGDTSVGQIAVMLWDGVNRWLYAIRFHPFSGPSQTIVDGLAIKRRLPNVAAPLALNLQAWFIGATVTAAQIFAGNGQAANYSPAYIKAKVA